MVILNAKWNRIIRTINLYQSFFALGMCFAVVGPTLIDLGAKVGVDDKTMSYLLVGTSISHVVGSLNCAFVMARFNRQLFLALCVFMAAATTFIIPWCKQFWALVVTSVAGGVFTGALAPAGSVLLFDLYQDVNPAPFLQALHFMFGVGGLIAPLIAEPFLSPTAKNQTKSEDDAAYSPVQLGSLMTDDPDILSTAAPAEDNHYYVINAYIIVGSMALFVTACLVIFYLIDPTDIKSNTEKDREVNESGIGRLSLIVIGLASVQILFYIGMENSYNQLLATFAHRSKLQMSKNDASYLTSAYWGAYTAVRFVSIFTSSKVSPFNLLFVNIVTMNVAAVLLVFFGNTNETMLWIGNVILGAAMASTFPSIFAWAERYVGISNKVSALFVICGSIGGITLQFLVGAFVEDFPPILMYGCLVCTVVCFVIFILQWRLKVLVQKKMEAGSMDYSLKNDF